MFATEYSTNVPMHHVSMWWFSLDHGENTEYCDDIAMILRYCDGIAMISHDDRGLAAGPLASRMRPAGISRLQN